MMQLEHQPQPKQQPQQQPSSLTTTQTNTGPPAATSTTNLTSQSAASSSSLSSSTSHSSSSSNSSTHPPLHPASSTTSSLSSATFSPANTASFTSNDGLDPEDLQAQFKIAANALTQIYKRAWKTSKRDQRTGYRKALQDMWQACEQLSKHPLAIHSGARSYVPLEVVLEALAQRATREAAEAEEGDGPGDARMRMCVPTPAQHHPADRPGMTAPPLDKPPGSTAITVIGTLVSDVLVTTDACLHCGHRSTLLGRTSSGEAAYFCETCRHSTPFSTHPTHTLLRVSPRPTDGEEVPALTNSSASATPWPASAGVWGARAQEAPMASPQGSSWLGAQRWETSAWPPSPSRFPGNFATSSTVPDLPTKDLSAFSLSKKMEGFRKRMREG